MTFSASGAIEKEKSFVVTAEYRSDYGHSYPIDYNYSFCGAGTAYAPDNTFNIGSITPQEIDGFKLIGAYDYDYSEMNEENGEQTGDAYFMAVANHKCILHIKGKDYRLDRNMGNGRYTNLANVAKIGIKDKEQIKVTYTLL